MKSFAPRRARRSRDRVLLEVRSLHFVAEVQQHLGDAAHAAAADADEVDAMDAAHAVVHARSASPMRAAPAAMQRSASRAAASVTAAARAASRHREQPVAIGRHVVDDAPRRSGGQVALLHDPRRRRSRPAPRRSWSDGRRRPRGTALSSAPRPAACSSAMVMAPARHTREIRPAVRLRPCRR